MPPIARPHTDDDVWRVRARLREAYLLDDRRQRGWHVARFDDARAHVCPNDLALVGGYGAGANALYSSVVGTSFERYEAWSRRSRT